MRILVTGANGFLGNNLVRELLERKHEVVAFVLENDNVTGIEALPITIRYGNLLKVETLIEHSKDCDAIIHTAAYTEMWPSRNKISWAVNLEGTRNVLNAVKTNAIKRLVYVGTANSFGFGTKENPGTEETPYQGDRYGLDYMDSKYQAHMLVEKEVKENKIPAVIVNPTFMFGPHDAKPGPGAMLMAVKNGKLPGFAPGGRNLLSVRYAAIAISNALTKGEIGESYILAGENLKYDELFAIMAKVAGVKPPSFKLPRTFIMLWGGLGSLLGKLGIKPLVSKEMAAISCDDHFFSSEKAQKYLDLPVTSAELAIQECHDWLEKNGYFN